MDKRESDLSTFNLLQPSLLTETELKEILISRCVEKDLSSCTKCELMELFQRVALPLPQRDYGLTRREQRLSQKQSKRTKVPVSGSGSSKEISVQPEKKNLTILENSSGSVENISSRVDRLKPPPDLINYKRKTIKINESSKKMIRTQLDKIVIKNKPKKSSVSCELVGEETSATPQENGRRRVAASPASSATPASRPAKAIRLKRELPPGDPQPQPQAETSSESRKEETPQKKRQKIVIAW